MTEGALSTYHHKFGTFIFGNHIDYRSSLIESLIEPKRRELDKNKRMEASLIAYEFLILQHATLKCVLENKYLDLINVHIYDKFIAPKLLRRHSQYAIVALTRSGAVLANQEILLAFTYRKNNWIKRNILQVKNKEETQRKKLLEMQVPTSVQIEKQVSVEVDNQLNQKVCESALKKLPSKRNKKRKRKGLAQSISQTTNRTNSLVDTVHETILERAAEETGVLEHGEIIPNIPITTVTNAAPQNIQQQTAQTAQTTIQANIESNVARGRGQGRGRG